MRRFGLLHPLWQASLRIEQTLCPEEYDRMTREIQKELQRMLCEDVIVIGSVATEKMTWLDAYGIFGDTYAPADLLSLV
ncbi:hypothetical protein [Zoogloea sp.]|uniref:hypothetical protein n=1 Tax=Zoogloea sp. TaxID=49181 RepID=UPI00321F9395